MSNPLPYLSIVLAGRNDNYGGDFEERFSLCVQWLCKMLGKHRINCELLIVNYNPVADRPSLEKLIPTDFNREYVSIRLITVSNEVHQSILSRRIFQPLPFLEYMAKNTGISRAKGEFILVMNPDIIIHPAVFKIIAEKQLVSGKFYRVDRYDYHKPAAINLQQEEKVITQLTGLSFKMHVEGRSVDFAFKNFFALRVYRKLNTWYNKWKIYINYYKSVFNPWYYPRFLLQPELMWHCNASGDFMLMHRNDWHTLNGYSEQNYLPLHVDALLVVKAGAAGIYQQTFLQPVFHQEHERRYEHQNRNAEMNRAYDNYYNAANDMMRHSWQSIYYIKNENWGLSNLQLPETYL